MPITILKAKQTESRSPLQVFKAEPIRSLQLLTVKSTEVSKTYFPKQDLLLDPITTSKE
jgi:hypothetical protein